MANIDKNIVITPNISNTSEPKIVFTGGNNNPTTLRVLDDGTLSFEGGAGQLFSISNTATGQIFAVNDISGYPLSEVYSNGFISLARSYGRVSIGSNTTPAAAALSVQSNTTVTGIDILGAPQTAGGVRFSSGSKISPVSTKELVFLDTNQIRFTDGVTWQYDDWGAIAYSTANSSMWIGKGGTGSGPIMGNSNTVANINFVGVSAFTISNSSVTKITLAANGNFGIGNTTPAHKLRIEAGSLSLGNTTSSITISIPTTVEASATNYVLNANGSWTIPTAAAVAGGANTQIQYNNSGSAAGSAAFTFNNTSNAVGMTGQLNLSGGANAISFVNATSNYIAWNTAGIGAPTVTSRSVGTKLVLYPDLGADKVDYAIGIEGNHLWFSTGQTGLAGGFKWYANTTNIMTSNATGLNILSGGLSIGGTSAIDSSRNGSFANVTIAGNLTVSGTTTYINTTTLNIGDNIITLNADLPGATAPTENAGIEVNRGSSANVSFIWDETNDVWASQINGVSKLTVSNTNVTVTGNTSLFLGGMGGSEGGELIFANTTGGTGPIVDVDGGNDWRYNTYNTTSNYKFNTGSSPTTKLQISANGNVGFSNSAPDATLAVTGTANVSGNVVIGGQLSVGANVIANTTALLIGNTTVNTVITQTTAAFNTNSTATALTAIANGYVGVGVAAPQAQLHIKGATPTIWYEGTGAGSVTQNIYVSNTSFGFVETLRIGGTLRSSVNINASQYQIATYGTSNSLFSVAPSGTEKFYVSNDGVGGPNNFFISANGNVGIGNTTPADKLVVAGNLRLTEYTETAYVANSGTAITLALTNGTVQVITLTGTATITMPAAVAGKSFVLYLKQDATGSRTVTWSTVKWPGGTAPTITSTASKQDIYSFFSDGTSWFGATVGQNYTP